MSSHFPHHPGSQSQQAPPPPPPAAAAAAAFTLPNNHPWNSHWTNTGQATPEARSLLFGTSDDAVHFFSATASLLGFDLRVYRSWPRDSSGNQNEVLLRCRPQHYHHGGRSASTSSLAGITGGSARKEDGGGDVKCNYQILIGSKAGGRYGYIKEGPKDTTDDAHAYHSHPVVPPSPSAKLSLAVVERQRAQKLAEQGSSRDAIILELGLDARKHAAVDRLVQYQSRKKRDSDVAGVATTTGGENASPGSHTSPSSSSLNAAAAAAAAVAAVAMGQMPPPSPSPSTAAVNGGMHSTLTAAPSSSTTGGTTRRSRKRVSTTDPALLAAASGSEASTTTTAIGARATRRQRLSTAGAGPGPAHAHAHAVAAAPELSTSTASGSNHMSPQQQQQQQQAAARMHGIYTNHNGSIHSDAWLTAPAPAPAHAHHSHSHHTQLHAHTGAAPPPPPPAPVAHGANGSLNGHHSGALCSNGHNHSGSGSSGSSSRENAELLRGLHVMFGEMMQNWLQAEERPDGMVGLQLKREWILKLQGMVEAQRLDLQSR